MASRYGLKYVSMLAGSSTPMRYFFPAACPSARSGPAANAAPTTSTKPLRFMRRVYPSTQLRVPVPAPFGGQVERVPERPEQVDVAIVLAAIGAGAHHLGGPEVADRALAAHEHVHHRPLRAAHILAVVVAVVGVV